MKKIILMLGILLLPQFSFAQTAAKTEFLDNYDDAQFFLEWDISLYSYNNLKIEIDGINADKIKSHDFNDGGGFLIGLNTKNNMQVFLSPSFSKDDNIETKEINLGIDFMPFKYDIFQPFIRIGGGYMSYEEKLPGGRSFSDSTFGFFIGGGAKYDFNSSFYVKVYGLFSMANFDKEVGGLDLELNSFGISLRGALGYKF